MSAPLPVAVFGSGKAGLRQARAVVACAELSLTAVIDPAEDGRARAEEEGFPTAADAESAPAGTVAAIVAGASAARASMVETAAARGWALLVDHPLATTLRDARRVLAAAEGAGVPLLVGHHRRHHACVAAAREAVQGGLLGRLVSADAVWFMRRPEEERSYAWRVQSGGGPVLAHMIHDIDLLRWLAGDIAMVSALASRGTKTAAADDSAAAVMRFESGALAAVTMSAAGLSPWGWEAATREDPDFAPGEQDCLRLVGTEGAMSLPSLAYWRHGGAGHGDWSRQLTHLPLPCPPTDPMQAQLVHFAKVARGEAEPLVSGPDGLRTLAAALAVEESVRTGLPVNPDPDRPDAWEPTASAIFRGLSSGNGR